jgi:hypothetical protein
MHTRYGGKGRYEKEPIVVEKTNLKSSKIRRGPCCAANLDADAREKSKAMKNRV